MTIGEGIFFSSLVLGTVALFIATKDRWNWRKIAVYGFGAPVALIALVVAGVAVSSWHEKQPRPQASFEKIELGASPADVRFLKGEPIPEMSTNERWLFQGSDVAIDRNKSFLIIRFSGNRVSAVTYTGTRESAMFHPYLLGFSIDSNYADVTGKLGEPSFVDQSADGLRRLASFSKYNAVFEFSKGEVVRFGIYDPATEPPKYVQQPDQATSAPARAPK